MVLIMQAAWWWLGGEPMNDGSKIASAQPDVEKACRAKGLKLTNHQRFVVRLVSEARDYPDFVELYRRAGAANPRISRATVSRTLTLLIREGIIERHMFQDGRLHYEQMPQRHHGHLIDLSSGKVCEFNSPEIERLQEKIARELGYKLIAHRLELYATPVPTGVGRKLRGKPA